MTEADPGEPAGADAVPPERPAPPEQPSDRPDLSGPPDSPDPPSDPPAPSARPVPPSSSSDRPDLSEPPGSSDVPSGPWASSSDRPDLSEPPGSSDVPSGPSASSDRPAPPERPSDRSHPPPDRPASAAPRPDTPRRCGSPASAAPPPGQPAPQVPSPDDEAVLHALGEALTTADPVRPGWRQAALDAFDWLALDAEPAELAYDAVEDVHRPLGQVPGAGVERRRLRFAARDVEVEVEVQVTSQAVGLLVRVTPGDVTRIQALLPDGTQVAAAGESGSFRFEELPRGPVSLLVESRRPVKTGWIVP